MPVRTLANTNRAASVRLKVVTLTFHFSVPIVLQQPPRPLHVSRQLGAASLRPNTSKMCSLPAELWHIVASHLSIHDATQLRLVSTFFADVAGAHILPVVTFHMVQDDFARLRGIASNRVLAANVKSIIYWAEEYESPVVSFERFKRNHEDWLRWEAPPSSTNSNQQAEAADDSTLWHEYEKYERMVAVQDQIKAEMGDLACLRDVLAKFTGLRHATMLPDSMFDPSPGTSKLSPFQALVRPPTHWPNPEGVRHLEVMLEALTSTKTQVESLHARCFDWTFFDKGPTELERLFRPVLSAVHVELEFSLDLENDLHVEEQIGKCRQLMGQGMVRDVLARMMKLKMLHVGFPGDIDTGDIDAPRKPAVVRNIISPSHHWPNLTQLELSGVEGDRHTVMKVLRLHKDTLRFLCLQDFDLGETSWKKLLPDIRNTMYLEGVQICGELTGHVEEYPDEGERECWDFGWHGVWRFKMKASINFYCRNRGKDYPDELPLTNEVVEKYYDQYVGHGGLERSEPGWEATGSWPGV